MKVTDIYIERDFVNENRANAKVIKYVFGKINTRPREKLNFLTPAECFFRAFS